MFHTKVCWLSCQYAFVWNFFGPMLICVGNITFNNIYKLQFKPLPLTPSPGRGNKLLLLFEFPADIQLKTRQKKVPCPPSPVGEGVRGRGLNCYFIS